MLSLELILPAVWKFFVSHPIVMIVVGTIIFATIDYFVYYYPKRCRKKTRKI